VKSTTEWRLRRLDFESINSTQSADLRLTRSTDRRGRRVMRCSPMIIRTAVSTVDFGFGFGFAATTAGFVGTTGSRFVESLRTE